MPPMTAGWTDFLVAVARAAGALLGLIFVSLSINLARIIALPGVTGRAAQALIVLGAVLLGALAALIPSQTSLAFGGELLVVTGLAWAVPMALMGHAIRHKHHGGSSLVVRVVMHQAVTIPGLVARVLLMLGTGRPLVWFAADVLLSFGVGLVSAWVLLVEILR
jgi:hypothetical protein